MYVLPSACALSVESGVRGDVVVVVDPLRRCVYICVPLPRMSHERDNVNGSWVKCNFVIVYVFILCVVAFDSVDLRTVIQTETPHRYASMAASFVLNEAR